MKRPPWLPTASIAARMALPLAAPGQKPQLVAQGGEIGPYRLTAITADRVDLLGPQGAISLHPQFVTAVPAAVAN